MKTNLTPETIDRFTEIVGKEHALIKADDVKPYVTEWRGRYSGKTPLVLKPGNREEVSQILKLAYETHTVIVPQGGNTGLVAGQMPNENGNEVVVSLSRLNKIHSIDPYNNTILVEAGCILDTIQKKALEYDRLFPLSLGAEGSCQIGGNLSSNAGGTNFLKYGSARDLCLGLEVVLPDGRIWEGLNSLRKNNTGYDLKNLFIGAEGTLGIITAAVMKLHPLGCDSSTSIIAVNSTLKAVELLHLSQKLSGNLISGFELLPRAGLDFVLSHTDSARDPLSQISPWYVLMEITGGTKPNSLRPLTEQILQTAFEDELITDAAIANSSTQANDFWQLRLAMSEVQKKEGASIKNDISVPISKIPEFIEKAAIAIEKIVPGCRPVPFGHIGDGNIHYNISQPKLMAKTEFLSREPESHAAINSLVLEMGGSISAEHGIGKIKAHLMEQIKSDVEMRIMRDLKETFDPKNLLNPGKLLP